MYRNLKKLNIGKMESTKSHRTLLKRAYWRQKKEHKYQESRKAGRGKSLLGLMDFYKIAYIRNANRHRHVFHSLSLVEIMLCSQSKGL